MAYQEFVSGTPALASDINTYLMNQTVMVFTDHVARDAALTAPTAGMFAYLENVDHYTIYDGAHWVKFDVMWNAWTPTLTNLTQGAGGVISASYARVGKTIVAQVYVTMGSTPTVGGQFSISLPVDIDSSLRTGTIGTCVMRDATASVSYLGSVFATGSAPSVARMQTIGTAGAAATLSSQTASNPFTWATTSTSYFTFTIMYQGA